MGRIKEIIREHIFVDIFVICFLFVFVAILGFVAYEYHFFRLVIQAGPKNGFFYTTALAYEKQLEAQGFTVDVRSTESTLDIIDLVNDPESDIDIGFIAQAVDAEKYSNTRMLGAIELEPLFVFYQKKLGHLKEIADLKGKTIALGMEKSGTRQISEAVLAAYGVNEKNSKFVTLTLANTSNALKEGTIDAGFFLQPARQKLIDDLAEDANLSLLNIEQSAAIVNAIGAQRSMRTVIIPQGYFNLERMLPAKDITVPAEFVTVITKKTTAQRMVHGVMKAMKVLHGKQSDIYGRGYFPRQAEIAMALHPVAEAVYDKKVFNFDKYLPQWISDILFDGFVMVLPFLVFLAPLLAVIGVSVPHNILKELRYQMWLRDLQRMNDAKIKGVSLSERQKHKLARIRKKLDIRDPASEKCRRLAGLIHAS